MNKTKNIPIVFTYVADPVKAGAGKSYNEHISNITGAFATADYEGMISLVIDLFPNAKAIGTLYNPGEPNSYYHIEELKKIIKKRILIL